MPRTIGVGVIGMGWMGTVHARAYRQVNDRFHDRDIRARLVMCADEVATRAGEAREQLGFERSTTDWRELIANPDVEVVDITAPNALHLEMVLAAARAGKHILCEKPVGRTPDETAAIERAARQAGILTWVGFNYRWVPLVQYVRQLIADGQLGQITHYRGRFFAGYATNPHGVLSWRFQRDVAGLRSLGDLMSHVVDLANMLVGPIARVVGNRATFIAERPLATPGAGTHFTTRTAGPMGPVTNEDYVGALVRFANGAQGTLEVCRVINGPQCQLAFELNGTGGAASWDFERMNELQLSLSPTSDPSSGYTRVVSGPAHPFHARFNPGPGVGLGFEDLKAIEAYQFLESIATGRQGQPGFAEALAVAQVNGAIERSWDSGRWEDVRPIGPE